MSSSTSSSVSRRRKCLPKLYHSAKAGCLTMDEEMLQDLGIVIHSNGGEVCNTIFSPTLPSPSEDDSSGGEVCNAFLSPTLSSSSDDVTSVFWESDGVVCHFRDYMDQSTNIWKETVSRM